MNPDMRIVNAKRTTKAELIRLNAALAAENANLRGLTTDLQDTLARLTAKPVLEALSLNQQAQALAKKMRCQVRVREGKLEVYLHGGWNDVSTVAIPS
jgi:uncharacterized protein YydD (DUF2326 family)